MGLRSWVGLDSRFIVSGYQSAFETDCRWWVYLAFMGIISNFISIQLQHSEGRFVNHQKFELDA
ncbi:hypothetical protein BDV06DRAFT_190312 [Aspergillus oleicola]